MLKIQFPLKKKFDVKNYINFDRPYNKNNSQQFCESIEIYPNYLYNIMGRNGKGKTTLLNIVSLLTGFEGGYNFFGNDQVVNGNVNSSDKNTIRLNKYSYIFQDPHLINMYSVEENLRIVNEGFDFNDNIDLIKQKIEKEINKDIAGYLIEKINYLQKEKNNSPFYLSGGEKQLLSFIRAMIKPSNIVFADEPWANMDQKLKEFVESQLYLYLINRDVFSNIRNSKIFKHDNNTVMIITHLHQNNNNIYGNLDEEWSKIIPVRNNKKDNSYKQRNTYGLHLLIERYGIKKSAYKNLLTNEVNL